MGARNGLDDHGFSGLRLRTTRERDASRALPQCVATLPLKLSRGTAGYYMLVPGQFLLKDVVLLGAAVWSLGEALGHASPPDVSRY